MPTTPLDAITDYHVHVYYDPANEPRPRRALARTRRRANFRKPSSDAGTTSWSDRIRNRCIRSHFRPQMLAAFVPWLMLNRDGLTVLLHPETGDDFTDHTAHAAWFGAVLPLRLDRLSNHPPRLQVVYLSVPLAVCFNGIPALGLDPGPRWRYARSGPHKLFGVERRFLNQVSGTPFDC